MYESIVSNGSNVYNWASNESNGPTKELQIDNNQNNWIKRIFIVCIESIDIAAYY